MGTDAVEPNGEPWWRDGASDAESESESESETETETESEMETESETETDCLEARLDQRSSWRSTAFTGAALLIT